MATLKTFDVIGAREQLLNRIWDISPEETPFLNNGGKGSVKGTFTEWLVDRLAAPDLTNARVQGADVTNEDAVDQPSRIGNRTQISDKTAKVAGTVEATDRAGRQKEMSRAVTRKMIELKLDIENILLSNQGAVTGDPVTPSKTASILAFIKTITNKGATGVDPVWTSVPTDVRTNGTTRPFTEVIHKDILKRGYDIGAKHRIAMLGSSLKQAASLFQGISAIRTQVAGNTQATIHGAADVYVGDFGQITFVPNRNMRPIDVLYLDTSMYSLDFLRPFATTPLAKIGDSERRLINVEYMLRVNNEEAFGLATDLVP